MGKVVKRGDELEPCPEGLHVAVCVDVVELGLVKRTFKDKERMVDMVQLRWQVFPYDDAGTMLRTKKGKPFMVTQRLAASLHPKSALYKLLVSWRGRQFTPEELEGFDLDNILLKPCQLQIVQATKEGVTYANIEACVKTARGMEVPAAEEYVRVKDRPVEGGPAHEEVHPDDTPPHDDDDIPF